MQYRTFGKTGLRISALGFGAMRLPMEPRDGKNHIKTDECVAMFHRAFELGVNYVDTAYGYCEKQSEIAVGKALKSWRGNKVHLATKVPTWNVTKTEDYRRHLEEQLKKLDVPCIDFYHFHGLNAESWQQKVHGLKLLAEAHQARDEGLIKYISFSFHDKPAAMKPIVDSGAFASVLCQYNLLDRANEEAIAHAKEKGLGVTVMGPVGGGRLGMPSEVIRGMSTRQFASNAELALRFVLSNPNVDCAVSGMGAMAMVEENATVAAKDQELSKPERDQIAKAVIERKKLADLYCTGCNYCMPCPGEVNIPVCFEAMNYHRVYGLSEWAQRRYRDIGGEWTKGKQADACKACGKCEEKCPQKIKIRDQLKEVVKQFGKGSARGPRA